MPNSPIVLAISGASGAIYGKAVFDLLLNSGQHIELIITDTAENILKDECNIDKSYFMKDKVHLNDNNRYDTPIASGSYNTAGMVIAPCSMGCLGRISAGISSNLIIRAADVHLKEKRKLIIVPRETPLSSIHLENMLTLDRAGATILPAMPSFYSQPKTITELTNGLAGKILDHLEIPNNSSPRYKGNR